jgi:hypothetical protein
MLIVTRTPALPSHPPPPIGHAGVCGSLVRVRDEGMLWWFSWTYETSPPTGTAFYNPPNCVTRTPALPCCATHLACLPSEHACKVGER